MVLFQAEFPGGAAVYAAAVERRALRHEAGRALCRAVAGSSPLRAENGRPYIPGGPAVSLSHSGGLVACAVGPTAIGVDLERARTASPRLLARARAAGFDGPESGFLAWWTAREANCKRLGRGFTWGPLPPPSHCRQGTLEHRGETYFYTVCW